MQHFKAWLAALLWLACMSAFADGATDTSSGDDPFQQIVEKYRAENPKPRLPEGARKFRVQAEYALQDKKFDRAEELYGKALEIAPWWPQGHFDRALILGETKKYREAMREMKRYLLLVPDAPDARAAQDMVYKWEGEAGPGYEGPLVNGKANGKGFYTVPNGTNYEGSFVDGMPAGKGVITTANGTRYEGNIVDGKMAGKGVLVWANGDRYEGDFVDNKMTGKGAFKWVNGTRYEGEVVEGKMTGKGVFTWASGNRYEGAFVDGKRTGKGVFIKASGERHEDFVTLGVAIDTLSRANAIALHEPNLKGAHVIDVGKGSVAEQSGISRDDIIVEYGGKPVTMIEDLTEAIFLTIPGNTTQIKVFRKSHEITLNAKF